MWELTGGSEDNDAIGILLPSEDVEPVVHGHRILGTGSLDDHAVRSHDARHILPGCGPADWLGQVAVEADTSVLALDKETDLL